MIFKYQILKLSITGDTANHDQFVHSAEVCALFPTRLDRLHLVSRTTGCLRRRMTETQSFRSVCTVRCDRPYHLHPLHLLVYHCKSSHNLINYARAHNSLWLHTKVSSMNNLMFPLSLGGGPKEKQASPGIPRCLDRQVREYPGASIHPDVYLSCHLR